MESLQTVNTQDLGTKVWLTFPSKLLLLWEPFHVSRSSREKSARCLVELPIGQGDTAALSWHRKC
jgi:hypothetical protein